MNNKVIVIVGPTGVGKTDISISLAKELDGEIVSADSMQIYTKMDIGTAKITKEEMQGIPHHMIDICPYYESFSVALYKEKATKIIDDIISRGKTPIVAGGTGLYIDALFGEYEFGQSEGDEEIRKKYENIAKEKGNKYLHSLLKDIDTESYSKIHFNNVKRVIRALEVYDITGKPFTENNKSVKKREQKYKTVFVGLTRERSILYERIDKRVDKMIEDGLVKEVEMLYNGENKFSETALNGIGYKEVIYYLKGLLTFDEMLHILKRESRHYAKRQLTWLKRNKNIKWFDLDEESLHDILKYVQK